MKNSSSRIFTFTSNIFSIHHTLHDFPTLCSLVFPSIHISSFYLLIFLSCFLFHFVFLSSFPSLSIFSSVFLIPLLISSPFPHFLSLNSPSFALSPEFPYLSFYSVFLSIPLPSIFSSITSLSHFPSLSSLSFPCILPLIPIVCKFSSPSLLFPIFSFPSIYILLPHFQYFCSPSLSFNPGFFSTFLSLSIFSPIHLTLLLVSSTPSLHFLSLLFNFIALSFKSFPLSFNLVFFSPFPSLLIFPSIHLTLLLISPPCPHFLSPPFLFTAEGSSSKAHTK